ncbi:hypothetical protein E3N88_21474 [Mikania micrantha]|uniref:non-specific serine/threonine protein kinase n=1 Tax=Mikania micrantha TaxID=192012 RepID=A0A5N6NJX2_9ASTR|nr:hypothetical protein E3N88_21474 [Mikania micrantha]
MAPKKTSPWKTVLFGCFSNKTPTIDPQILATKPGLSQRLSISDVSSSLSVINGLSNSILGWNLQEFTFAELTQITHDFAQINYLGEGGFGTVHKGFIDDKFRSGLEAQPVAVKLLDLDGGQGHNEWLAEVTFLGQLRHPHLVKLIGYCCEDKNRLLVYEYMARGNLESQLFRRYSISLPWRTRIQIALGAAKGLAFLHGEEKPVIYRDFKTSNILLGSDYKAKLSDFGLAKDGPEGDETHTLEHVLEIDDFPVGSFVYTAPIEGQNNEEKDDGNDKKQDDDEKSCGGDEVVEVVEKKEVGRRRDNERKGHRHKHRIRSMRSRAVYSDTNLYKNFRKGANLPMLPKPK